LESSEGSSSEVNSPVSLEKAPITEGDKIQKNFDSEERACQTHNIKRDFTIGSKGVSKIRLSSSNSSVSAGKSSPGVHQTCQGFPGNSSSTH
jgi:hypothetical protein